MTSPVPNSYVFVKKDYDTDWNRSGIKPQRTVASALAIAVSQDDVTVLSTGDNFYDYGVEIPHDVSWNSSYEGVYYAQPRKCAIIAESMKSVVRL